MPFSISVLIYEVRVGFELQITQDDKVILLQPCADIDEARRILVDFLNDNLSAAKE